MYSCPLHNWSSFYEPCPSCFVTVTTSSTTGEISDDLKEENNLLKARVKYLEELIKEFAEKMLAK